MFAVSIVACPCSVNDVFALDWIGLHRPSLTASAVTYATFVAAFIYLITPVLIVASIAIGIAGDIAASLCP